MAARCSQKRKNCGECVCRLGKTFLKPADPVFHSTHASNYDSKKIQTIATSNSEHHNRFGSTHPHRDWSENKTNQYYWVHANVITDDYHNGMMPHTASWICGTGSTARVRRYVSFPTTNQCYARTLEAGMSGFHAVWCAIPESCGRTAPPADAMPSCNPTFQHVRKTRVVSRFCSSYSSEIRLHYPSYLTKILGWCFCIHACSLSSHFLLRPTNICENNSDLPVEASHDISSHSLYTAIKTLTVKISLTLLLLGPNSRLRTLMSNTINLRSSVHTGDPVSI